MTLTLMRYVQPQQRTTTTLHDDIDLLQMGANSGDPRYGEGWEDDDDEGGAQAQCAQQ